MNTKVTLSLLVLAALTPSVAAAQLRTTTGFPIGEKSRIHTSLELSTGYDTNRERLDNDREVGQLDDWRATIRPGLEIDVPGTTFKLGLRSQLSIIQYFGTGDVEPDTTFGGSVGLNMQLGSDDSVVSFKLDNQFVRTPEFFNEPGTIASDERRFQQWFNTGTARLTFRPGGRALEIDVGYLNRLALFDTDRNELPQGQQHGGLFEARWRFLPKTVLLFHADVSTFIVGSDPVLNNTDPRDDVFLTSEGLPIHVFLGAIGQVTSKLQAEITAGYGDTLSDDENRNTRGPIGSAVLKYSITESIFLRGGYRRTIEPIVRLSSFSSDAGFLEFGSVFFGRLQFQLLGQYELRTFAEIPGAEVPEPNGPDAPGLADGSTAQVIIGDARVDYWFFEWLRLGVSYRVLVQIPEEEARARPDDPNDPNDGFLLPGLQDFNRHQVFLNIGLRY